MPYRRTYRRRRTYKRPSRNRTYRRRFKARSRYSKRGQKLYLFKRQAGLGQLVMQNILPTYAGFTFNLSQVPGVTEFQNLYDQYKINCIKVMFLPQMTENISLGSVNNPAANARFFSTIDYNDSTPPTSVDDLRQYQSVKMTPCLKIHKRVIFKPKIVDSSGYTVSPWLNTTNINTNYYGLKVALEPMASSSTTTMTYNIEAKFYLSFKTVK